LQYSEFHYVPLAIQAKTESARFSTGEIVNIVLVADRAGPKDRGQHIVALEGAGLKEFTLAAHQNATVFTPNRHAANDHVSIGLDSARFKGH
jgi:hypothetical protein